MGISIWQLLIVLGIVVLIFGTKKLKNMGGDIGSAVKGFKSAIKDGDNDAKQVTDKEERVIDAEVESKDKNNV